MRTGRLRMGWAKKADTLHRPYQQLAAHLLAILG
jgi:hypothetical protein